jgi:hypothetical protein
MLGLGAGGPDADKLPDTEAPRVFDELDPDDGVILKEPPEAAVSPDSGSPQPAGGWSSGVDPLKQPANAAAFPLVCHKVSSANYLRFLNVLFASLSVPRVQDVMVP